MVLATNGEMFQGEEAVKERWEEFFESLLNKNRKIKEGSNGQGRIKIVKVEE